jgi:hypothetical protein
MTQIHAKYFLNITLEFINGFKIFHVSISKCKNFELVVFYWCVYTFFVDMILKGINQEKADTRLHLEVCFDFAADIWWGCCLHRKIITQKVSG